jgi:hypothetical protein
MGKHRVINQECTLHSRKSEGWWREKLIEIYVKEIESKYGVSKNILSDRGYVFTLAFWKQLQEAPGFKLDFSKAYNPEIGGQIERTNQIV